MPEKNKAIYYKEIDIKTAGKLKSLLLLFDRALVLLKQAKESPEKRNAIIVQTQNILAQLEQSLDFNRGGLAGDLFFVFDFLFEDLQRRDERAVDTALKMISGLRGAFAALSRKPRD